MRIVKKYQRACGIYTIGVSESARIALQIARAGASLLLSFDIHHTSILDLYMDGTIP